MAESNHYATLGLDRNCTFEQVRTAYRLLAKQHHPDLHADSADAIKRTQALNAAYETLGDSERRIAYDRELAAARKSASRPGTAKAERNLAQDVNLRLEDFLRGTTLEIRFQDPANPAGPETYPLVIPPGTAPGTRFRVPREEPMAGGFVVVRVRPQANFRFKARGSDLRCDLRISAERAAQGGTELVTSLGGTKLRVTIPRGVGRGEVLRLPGEGLPKLRGGRGDLLVRIVYSIAVRIARPRR